MNRHEAESLAGLLSFCARVVRLGRTLFTQSLFLFIAKHPAYNCQIKISKNLKADLRWWNELLPQFNGIRLLNDLNHVTDASNLGLGALLPDKLAEHTCRHPRAAPFGQKIASGGKHINIKETAAALRALERWGHLWGHARLIIHTDSSTVFTSLTQSSIRSHTMEPLKRIHLLAAKHDVHIEPHWIPGVQNKLADALSRLILSRLLICVRTGGTSLF
jgi:hypothetical protein